MIPAREQQWYINEFDGAELGDERLNMRLMKVVHQLSASPSSSINGACVNSFETKSAYRFFGNNKVEAPSLLEPHVAQTVDRIQAHPIILAVQDSTFPDYTSHPKTTGLGVNSKAAGKIDVVGLGMHTAYAVTPEGLPLGILHQHMWAREPKGKNYKSTNRRIIPIEQKESQRWITALNEIHDLTNGLDSLVIHVGDRENDFYEFINTANNMGAYFLIRANHDRNLQGPNRKTVITMREYMKLQKPRGFLKLEVPSSKDVNKLRLSQCRIYFSDLVLRPPQRRPMDYSLTPQSVKVIWLKEINCPKGEEPIDWMLLTNTPVEDLTDAMERVSWYQIRWTIECFHRILKSGCKVEDCRLGDGAKLMKYLTVKSIIAWRLHTLTLLGRHCPEMSCEMLLTKSEWKVLYCVTFKTKRFPRTPPTISKAMMWVAQLGGFQARVNDGHPGMTVIWRGWSKLQDMTRAYEVILGAA